MAIDLVELESATGSQGVLLEAYVDQTGSSSRKGSGSATSRQGAVDSPQNEAAESGSSVRGCDAVYYISIQPFAATNCDVNYCVKCATCIEQ